ncbi:hypothetical protein K435DRAFT_741534 [Dendrothele bispora CBS 962.96]|uniref:Sterol regulatory element-binding protein cleavage-activating protein n=1 Tax=Dendrothele bispora (strain CBS 962.96) TaxID=1314807 RepID=A0A4S8MX80_DENBC|nr:hypothetical protein K435DRAFT_741534 [Dendrothele bispora CBS 962.96]
MLQIGPWLLDRARTYGQRFFLQFGLHCATHQIRIILVSGVVITSLFYPALALYSSSQTKSIYDIFISPNSGINAHKDLVDLWSIHSSLQVKEDPLSRGKCVRGGRIVRVERVLVESEHYGILNNQILLSTLEFETSLRRRLSSSKVSCVKKPDGECLVLSPLAFWNYDGHALLSDPDILGTLASENVSVAGIPVTPQMVLAGRESVAGDTFDSAEFLALTYFFTEYDCTDTAGHELWLDTLSAAPMSKADIKSPSQDPTLIALEYDPTSRGKKGWSAISAFLYLSYASFFVYVFWSMRQINSVHSRVGVAFTAAVEIVVSTITSLSVCALVGFKVTMVPWELLPIVIVFVGAENMFNLVDAVGKTSVTLTVKQRIAEGLSRAGTSNTLKVVSYNAILGIIAVFAAGAIRQFCVFAIVVLVAHWFLAHTFFMAVLSIDIQRLELEELLRQDSGLTPSLATSNAEKSPSAKSMSIWSKFGFFLRKVLSGRAKKNLSLFLMLAITATLYYATLPPISANSIPSQITSKGALSRNTSHLDAASNNQDPALRIWKTLNPNDPVFHIRIEGPSKLTFRPDIHDSDSTGPDLRAHKRWSRPVKLVFWLVKIMVLPIAATTFVLWILTLYLLKDAELLDAQKSHSEPETSESKEDPTALEHQISFSTLPRAFSSDVELVATSVDGRVVISAGLHNEVVIWQMDSHKHFSIDASEILLRAASSSLATSTLTSVAMDDKGEYCAVGTGAGVIAVWDIRKDRIRSFPHLSLPDSSAGVVQLEFIPGAPTKQVVSTPPMSEPASPVLAPALPPEVVFIVATYENGMAVKYAIQDLPALAYFYPSRRVPVVRSQLVDISPENQLLVAFCLEDGTVELFDAGDSNGIIKTELIVQAGNPADTVSKVHVCRALLGGEIRLIVAAATDAGIVSLWDGQTGECIRILDEQYGRINQLRVASVPTEACHYCGHLPQDSFSLSFSVDHVVRFFKYYLTDDDRRCTCTSTVLRRVSSRENLLRSRSNSVTSSVGSSSPLISRSRRVSASASEVSPFPVSGHGVHSRRASEKDASRRTSEILSLPVEFEEGEYGRTVGPQETGRISSLLWQNSSFVRVGDTTCERGGWDVVPDGTVVGVRRKPRPLVVDKSSPNSSSSRSLKKLMSSKGLSSTILERWEIWTFNPCITHLQSSALSSITAGPDTDASSELESESLSITPSPSISSSSFSNSDSSTSQGEPATNLQCIPRLPFTRVSPFIVTHSRSLAGFGNTLGVFDFPKLS